MTSDHPNHKWWTLFAMCFALFMIMLDNTIVNVALPSIQHSLNPSPENLEWTINAYVLVFATLILLGGKLGDRYGRKRIFLVWAWRSSRWRRPAARWPSPTRS